ncbi:MAG: nucleotide pyrophosphohydrolase [Clostridia bacterium]|nr:nucleotide pyrophosphohydrolase [Clostridia bacterium]
MDNKASIDDLKKMVKAFCEVRDWDQYHNPKDLAIGISTEANELLDLFRFKSDSDMKELFNNEDKFVLIREEIADVLFFILRFAQRNNIDLHDALIEKLEKNAKKYPVEIVKGDNRKYNVY